MDKYIKVDDLLDRFTFEHGDPIPEVCEDGEVNTISFRDAKAVIRSLPAADVAPVVHGKWVLHRPVHNPYMGSGVNYRCSVCDRPAGYKQVMRYSFCPRCGAKMEEVQA